MRPLTFSYQWVMLACSPWINRPGYEFDQSSPCSVEVSNVCSYTATCRSDRDDVTFFCLCHFIPLSSLQALAFSHFISGLTRLPFVCFTNFPVNDSTVLLQFVNLKVFCCIYINSVAPLTSSADCFFQIYFDLHEFRNNNTWGNLSHSAHIWKVLNGLCKRSHDCGLFEEQSP